MNFDDLSQEEKGWLDAYLDGTITPEAFEALQSRMLESAAFRAVMRRYLSLDDSLQNDSQASAEKAWLQTGPRDPDSSSDRRAVILPFTNWAPVAAAAGLAFLLGLGFMYWGLDRNESSRVAAADQEYFAEGFAVVNRLSEVQWPDPQSSHREGDTLGAETFRLVKGTAEIQFFSGATMMLEGPAQITLRSAWEARCQEGSVRMRVPPAARGFRLHAPSTEIVDLGTEFGLEVRGGKAHVEVFDGEISLRQKDSDERILSKGAALGLLANGSTVEAESGKVLFPDLSEFGLRAEDERRLDYNQWLKHRDLLAQDKRLIAYYTFDREEPESLIPNLALPRNSEFDGAVVLAEPVDGRWPGLKKALEFRRPGARVRVNILGEFSAYTFMCWVRIDSLDRWYNALFMGDGYETGEPHWQIRDDGKMMLSVMVDDTKPNPGAPNDAGFHRVYYSPPMWDISMSGQWLHLTSVFDPENRSVSHYVNGKRIHQQEIEDRFFINKLRIGNAEIGNWGQPFREEPKFAIRNLNGRMDEIAIFGAALQEGEIEALYERSRAGQ